MFSSSQLTPLTRRAHDQYHYRISFVNTSILTLVEALPCVAEERAQEELEQAPATDSDLHTDRHASEERGRLPIDNDGGPRQAGPNGVHETYLVHLHGVARYNTHDAGNGPVGREGKRVELHLDRLAHPYEANILVFDPRVDFERMVVRHDDEQGLRRCHHTSE